MTDTACYSSKWVVDAGTLQQPIDQAPKLSTKPYAGPGVLWPARTLNIHALSSVGGASLRRCARSPPSRNPRMARSPSRHGYGCSDCRGARMTRPRSDQTRPTRGLKRPRETCRQHASHRVVEMLPEYTSGQRLCPAQPTDMATRLSSGGELGLHGNA